MRRQTVQSISFNSPFEVVFTVTASVGSITAAGAGLLALWDRFQNSRIKTAEASTMVAAYEAVREHIELAGVDHGDVARLQEASSALMQLQSLESIEPPVSA